MLILDGQGAGYTAGVNNENRLLVDSMSQEIYLLDARTHALSLAQEFGQVNSVTFWLEKHHIAHDLLLLAVSDQVNDRLAHRLVPPHGWDWEQNPVLLYNVTASVVAPLLLQSVATITAL